MGEQGAQLQSRNSGLGHRAAEVAVGASIEALVAWHQGVGGRVGHLDGGSRSGQRPLSCFLGVFLCSRCPSALNINFSVCVHTLRVRCTFAAGVWFGVGAKTKQHSSSVLRLGSSTAEHSDPFLGVLTSFNPDPKVGPHRTLRRSHILWHLPNSSLMLSFVGMEKEGSFGGIRWGRVPSSSPLGSLCP